MRKTALIVATAVAGLLAAQTSFAQQSSTSSASRSTSAGGLATGPSNSNPNGRTADMPPMTARAFAQKMAMSDMFEIESSNLALDHSKNNDIKSFARMMVQDHTKSTEKLKAAAKKGNLDSALPKSLDQEHSQMLDQLRSASASEFDREYANDQAQGHEQAVSLLRTYSQNGDNADLKQFASDVLPTVEQHLAKAKQLETPASASR